MSLACERTGGVVHFVDFTRTDWSVADLAVEWVAPQPYKLRVARLVDIDGLHSIIVA